LGQANAIGEAAGQLLVTHGRAAITTNAMAARAGVAIGSLYPMLRGLFHRVYDQALRVSARPTDR
jgi:hypothetical protein